jgi:hypothetical protein
LKLRVCDYPNPLRQRGIELLRLTQCLEKSLAHASGYDNPHVFAQLICPSLEHRNFKTYQRWIGVSQKDPSLRFRVVIFGLSQNWKLFQDCSLTFVAANIRAGLMPSGDSLEYPEPRF